MDLRALANTYFDRLKAHSLSLKVNFLMFFLLLGHLSHRYFLDIGHAGKP